MADPAMRAGTRSRGGLRAVSMVGLLSICGWAVAAPVLVSCRPRALTWDRVLGEVRGRFPTVRHIQVDSLVAWLGDATRPPPLLLDVRTPEEFAVSHLPGAMRVQTVAEARAALRRALAAGERPPAAADAPYPYSIVTYCSVGWRSSELAAQLVADGIATEVVNLEGSIFAWANAGHPVVQNGQPANRVHPFDRHWGQLLDARVRMDLDELKQ